MALMVFTALHRKVAVAERSNIENEVIVDLHGAYDDDVVGHEARRATVDRA